MIVALDVPDLAGLTKLLDRLDGRPAFYKVGLELFVGEGERAIELVRVARRARLPGPQAARHPRDGGARGGVGGAQRGRAADRAHVGRLRDAVARGRGGGRQGEDPRRHGADQPGRGRPARRGHRADDPRDGAGARAHRGAGRDRGPGLLAARDRGGARRGAGAVHRRPRHPPGGGRGRGQGRSEARRDARRRRSRPAPTTWWSGGRSATRPIRRRRSTRRSRSRQRRCERPRSARSSSASVRSASWSAYARTTSTSSTSPTARAAPEIEAVVQAAKERRVSVEFRPRRMVAELAPGAVHQGIVAIAGRFRYATLEDLLAAAKEAGRAGADRAAGRHHRSAQPGRHRPQRRGAGRARRGDPVARLGVGDAGRGEGVGGRDRARRASPRCRTC